MRHRSANVKLEATLGTVALLSMLAGVVVAGNDEPPGPPPASTMQTLIRAVPFPIMASGSYALEGDIDAPPGAAGITISASHVTLDLRGHSLRNGAGDGVSAAPGTTNIAVVNGTVAGWSEDGVDLTNAVNTEVRSVRAEGNVGTGIKAGGGSVISGCAASNNTGTGIIVSASGTVSNSIANGNGGDGFGIGGGFSITNCAAYLNTGMGFFISGSAVTATGLTARENNGTGIRLGPQGTLIGCTAFLNGDAAGDDGILSVGGGTIVNCTSSANFEDGIEVGSDSHVAGNTCDGNGTVSGAGIHATGADNRIDGNLVTDNDRGIDVDAGGNTIFGNTASGNGDNYGSIVGGNDLGPIGTAAAATSPWANIAF